MRAAAGEVVSISRDVRVKSNQLSPQVSAVVEVCLSFAHPYAMTSKSMKPPRARKVG